ncbi:hypothetical protein PIROE2DRAFT_14046 [Piromyces sp. E2]|nr:hypothetical protein PIROE2DRAFT_14046 [Piromyces sp. E2]|eukprot:OUM60230.1 hypothetical protein PIROE2DRAFT_14046 [Piromyces sp. E2]
MQVDDILLNVLGELFGGKIKRPKTANSKELTFEKYANKSLSAGQLKKYSNVNKNEHPFVYLKYYLNDHENKKHLFVETLTGKTIEISYDGNDTILKLKKKIQDLKGIPIYQQRFNRKQLENDKNVLYCNIKNPSTIILVQRPNFNEYHLPDDLFDSKYHYDFTNVRDTGKKFFRGGLEYKRPYKYEDTQWLGCSNNSNNNTEWAVSYHGTKNYCVESIVKEGLKPGNRNSYGIGIYCTPDIKTAEKYAEIFTSPITNKKYKIVFQNRVKPSSIVKCKSKGGPTNYWYIEDGKDIRPYGICIKEVK